MFKLSLILILSALLSSCSFYLGNGCKATLSGSSYSQRACIECDSTAFRSLYNYINKKGIYVEKF